MAGFLKILAFSLTGIFVILFSLIFITKLGQGKDYKFIVGLLSMVTAVSYGLITDLEAGFFSIRSILPFMGALTLLIIASFLFGKATFTEEGVTRYEGGPPRRRPTKGFTREGQVIRVPQRPPSPPNLLPRLIQYYRGRRLGGDGG